MKENIGKYLENNFWPKLSKEKLTTEKKKYELALPAQKKVTFFKKIEEEFYKFDVVRKGIVAANVLALIYDSDVSFLLMAGSAFYLFNQAKKIRSTPEKIFNLISDHQVQTSYPTKSFQKRTFNYDPTSIGINDIQLGYLIDYNLKTYQVVEHFQLNSNSGAEEEKLVLLSGIDELVLFKYFDQVNLKIRVAEKVNIYSIDESLDTEILLKQQPKAILTVNGKKFYRDAYQTGSIYSFTDDKVTHKYGRWDYYDESRVEYLTIEQVGAKNFHAYVGKLVHETAFSDILPKK
ncbi:DUF4178 domain-containing protein [Flammeovirga sp. SJP92]|uniref:DUF4178 domain-containing protein n=1 Tax=Flammeovirga sp. SJP92 TaxID=1775430 RepID=UPI0007884430|nr:DUF4178 domain-containing protein [Flammeovirga sp. SJP92]KXX68832.1 hypothetical protein AVL50_18525 [Flammeovirga sp. SJP92]